MSDAVSQAVSHDEDALGKAYDRHLMRRLVGYLQPYRTLVAFAIAAIIGHSLVELAPPYLTKIVIDRYIPAGNLAGLAAIAALYLTMLLAAFVLEYAQTWTMQVIGQRIMFDIRMQVFSHLQRIDVRFYDRNPVGRLMTRVTTDVDVLNELFTSGVVAIFGDVFTLLGIMGVLVWLDWRLALVAFSVLPLIAAITQWFRRHVRHSYRTVRTWIARINAFLQERITGMATVQLFRREVRDFADFDAIDATHRDANIDSIFYYAVFYPAIELVSALAASLIIWIGGGWVMDDALTLGSLVAFLQYSQRFFRPISDMSEKFNTLQGAMASSERIFALLDTPVHIASPGDDSDPRADLKVRPYENPDRMADLKVRPYDNLDRMADLKVRPYDNLGGPPSADGPAKPHSVAGADRPHDSHSVVGADLQVRPVASSSGHDTASATPTLIRFEDVTFAYVEGEPVLKHVSFDVAAGQRIAIVGATGSGKTTIVNLLLRFYDVQQGRITVNGVDVREMRLPELRAIFGLVLQDVHLFSGTIASNIRLGNDAISDAQVRRAIDAVHAGPFIDRLPGGLATPVAERGATLSTGQKQLLSFARALAFDSRVLILDEATSSIDTETELLIRDALAVVMRGRTTIAIAHRLSTIQDMDRILVLHKGELRESGTHQELLARRGIYHRLYELQFRDVERRAGVSD